MGLALLLPNPIHPRRARSPLLTYLPSGPSTRDDVMRRTCSRTAHSTDAIRRYAHRVPSGSCAHMLPCTQELSTPPDPFRPLAALHPDCGAPALSPHAPAALFMGHALVRPYVVSRLQPASSPCSCHRSLTPGFASGVFFALARHGSATPRRRRPSRRSVQTVFFAKRSYLRSSSFYRFEKVTWARSDL